MNKSFQMDENLKKIMERVNKNGLTVITSNRDYKSLPKKGNYIMFSNRRLKQTIIVKKDFIRGK